MLPKSDDKEDPRVTRTRNFILKAFTELLPEKGFHALPCKISPRGQESTAVKKSKNAHSTQSVPLTGGMVWEFHIGGYQVCHKWLKTGVGAC